MAVALRKEPGVQVELIDGNKGEFTVLVDGQAVAQKGDNLPSVDQVVTAVRKGTGVHAGA